MYPEEVPTGGPFKKWFLGVGVSLLPLAHAVHVVLKGGTTILGRGGSRLRLEGADSLLIAVFFAAAAAAIHFHYFWGLHQESQTVSQIGKLASAVLLLGALLTLVVRFFLGSIHA